jgi:hypothetical protein
MTAATTDPARRNRLDVIHSYLRGAGRTIVREVTRGLFRGAVAGALAGVAVCELLALLLAALGWIPGGFFCPPFLWYGIWGFAGGLPTGLLWGGSLGVARAVHRTLSPVLIGLALQSDAAEAPAPGADAAPPAGTGAAGAAPAPVPLSGGWRGWILEWFIGGAAVQGLQAVESLARSGEIDVTRRRTALENACQGAGGVLGDALFMAFIIPLALVLLFVAGMMLLPPLLVWLG